MGETREAKPCKPLRQLELRQISRKSFRMFFVRAQRRRIRVTRARARGSSQPRNIYRQAECFAGRSKGLFSRTINAVARNKRQRQREKASERASERGGEIHEVAARRAVLTSADCLALEIVALSALRNFMHFFPHRSGAASCCRRAEFYARFNYLRSSFP